MQKKITKVIPLAVAASLTLVDGGIAMARECTLHPLAITPKKSGDFNWYYGQNEKYTMEVQNFKPAEDVDIFPEPPLIINNKKYLRSCNIDGGIWKKDGFYTSSDGETLVVFEFSGERSSLISYDLATCDQKGGLDISGVKWNIDKTRIVLTADCRRGAPTHCRSKREIVLDDRCSISK